MIVDVPESISKGIIVLGLLTRYEEELEEVGIEGFHFYAWEKGLKTGMYYLRTKAAADAIKFTLEKEEREKPKTAIEIQEEELKKAEDLACSLDNPEACEACGS